jgi:P27 family predicted phage terminase small subunit
VSSPELSVVSLRPTNAPAAPAESETRIEPPEWLSEYAKEAWERLAPYCQLAPTDVDEFAAYCETLAEFRESSEVISEAGLLIIDPASGMPVPNPIQMVRNNADRKIAFWANRFRR